MRFSSIIIATSLRYYYFFYLSLQCPSTNAFQVLISPSSSTATSKPASVLLRRSTTSDTTEVRPSGLESSTEERAAATAQKTLGLLTFDLDDTLYPIAPVIDEANRAFAKAMTRFGFAGIQPMDIVETGKTIRSEIARTDPEAAAVLTHTQIRELAIRRELENALLARKLRETADDWETPVDAIADEVVEYARQWASTAVSSSVVNSVLTAWEMERHHAAERHLYPEILDVLNQIKEEHPSVIIGAVTDGRANPLFMTFTLAPLFDFCMSWEDDQGGRSKFFKELSSVEGNAELTWIYDAAYEKFKELHSAKVVIDAEAPGGSPVVGQAPVGADDTIWIHVGDDLAYDVGGSASCGAKTILFELARKYGQTARCRFADAPQPSWSTTMAEELQSRRVMNDAAMQVVDRKVSFISQLPEAISEILEQSS